MSKHCRDQCLHEAPFFICTATLTPDTGHVDYVRVTAVKLLGKHGNVNFWGTMSIIFVSTSGKVI